MDKLNERVIKDCFNARIQYIKEHIIEKVLDKQVLIKFKKQSLEQQAIDLHKFSVILYNQLVTGNKVYIR